MKKIATQQISMIKNLGKIVLIKELKAKLYSKVDDIIRLIVSPILMSCRLVKRSIIPFNNFILEDSLIFADINFLIIL